MGLNLSPPGADDSGVARHTNGVLPVLEFEIGPDEPDYGVEHGDVLLSVQLVLAEEHSPLEAAQRAWSMADEEEEPPPRRDEPRPVVISLPPLVEGPPPPAPVERREVRVRAADLRGSAWLPSAWQPAEAPPAPAPVREVPPPSPTPRQLVPPTPRRVFVPPEPAPVATAPAPVAAAPAAAPPMPAAPPRPVAAPRPAAVPPPAPVVPAAPPQPPQPIESLAPPTAPSPTAAGSAPPSDLGLIDAVTGAGTVRALRRDVAAARSWDLPDVAPPAVIAIDIEPIPEIRNQVGDEAADRLLKAVVETIPWVLRARDRVYRIGPDDLALLMPATGSEGVEAALVRLLRSIPAALSERGMVEVSLVPRPLDPATLEKGHPVWLELPAEEQPGEAADPEAVDELAPPVPGDEPLAI